MPARNPEPAGGRAARGIALGALLALLAFDAPPAGAQDLPAVLLNDAPVMGPGAAVGSGVEPSIRIRLTVDAKGKVEQVEVLSIQPSSPFDDAFREAVVDQLKRQRYAPALVQGEPKATQLEWTLQFRDSSSSYTYSMGRRPPMVGPAARVLGLDQIASDFRLRQMPAEAKKKMVLRYSALAEKHLAPGKRQQAISEHFVVVSDHADPKLPAWAANNLEAAYDALHGLWRSEVEPLPDTLRIVVYLYATSAQFEALRSELGSRTATYYPPGLITYSLELITEERLLSFLIHEASHAYSDRHLRPTNVIWPFWLEEGMAEYVANSEIREGRLVPGKTAKTRIAFSHMTDGPIRVGTVAGRDSEYLQQALRRPGGLPLAQLALAGDDQFYGKDWPHYYAVSWAAVHFLRHGRREWEGLFPRLILYLVEGYSLDASLATVYGAQLADLEADFKAYAKKF